MKKNHRVLLDQVNKFASEGRFGESVIKATKEYNALPLGIATTIKCVVDFHSHNSEIDDEISQIRSLFFQLIVVAYRECKKVNEEIASIFLNSFIVDHPEAPESALVTKWCSLAQASLAFREVAQTENRLLIWQQSTKIFQAYNEFLNGLLGFLIIAWRCAQKKKINPNVFSLAYGAKINQFEQITGGENGVFYMICRLAQPKIRNAIAHETIWLDSEVDKVRYIDGNKDKKEFELDLIEYMAFAGIGSHLCEPYLASIAAIIIWEEGSEVIKSCLPEYLIKVLSH